MDLSLGRIRLIDLRNPQRNREAYFGVKHLEIKNIRNEGDLYGVAAIVFLRSGLVNFGAPPNPDGSQSGGIWDLGLEWLKEAMGLQISGASITSTNHPPRR